MTDESPKPKRKRWRWIIAGVLLFVVIAAVGWWNWPREDVRFVGVWRVQTFGPIKPVNSDLILKANGTATWLRLLYRGRTTWTVEGNTLRFGIEPDGWLRKAVLEAIWTSTMLGGLDSEQWEIESVSHDEIKLHAKHAPDIRSELRRIR